MPSLSSVSTFLRTEPQITPFIDALNLKTGVGIDYTKALKDVFQGDVNFNSSQNTWNTVGVAVSTASALQAVYAFVTSPEVSSWAAKAVGPLAWAKLIADVSGSAVQIANTGKLDSNKIVDVLSDISGIAALASVGFPPLALALGTLSVGLSIYSFANDLPDINVAEKFQNIADGINSGWDSLKSTANSHFSDTGEWLLAQTGYGSYDEINQTWLTNVGAKIDDIKNFFTSGLNTVSPLILDLNNDGIQTSSLANSNIYFDFDANGHAQRTGWVDKNDGLLVLDKNHNGIIDNGNELFGNNTQLANGQTATDGFTALADIDSNHDGKIDSLDAQFNNLRIWQDANSNGITDAGELLTLTQAGIKSLNVNYNNTASNNNGNTDQQQGQFTKTDGTTGQMNDIWFAQDTARTVDQTQKPTISNDIKALPNVAGFGNVSNLQTAMSRDAVLKALVQSYHAAANNGASINDLQTRATAILNQWVGASNTAPNSRGEYISDARHLIALEAFMGQGFMQSAGINEGTPNPGPNAALELEKAYAKLYDYVNDSLLAQTINKPMFDSITYSWNATTNSIDINISQTLSLLSNNYKANQEQGLMTLSAFGRELDNQGAMGQAVLDKLHAVGNATGNDLLSS
jgi:hypothetical protein